MNGSGLVCLEWHPLGHQATSQRYCSLTKYGGSAWWTYNSPLLVGPEMDNTVINPEKTESSAVWDSSKGFCSEAPCRAAEQNPVEQRTGETPLIGEEHLSIGCQTSKNLEGLREKVDTLQVIKKNRCGAAKKRARKARLAEAPTGDSGSDRPHLLWLINLTLSRSPVHLGLHKEKDLLWLSRHLWRVVDSCEARVNDSGRPEALRRTGKLRGPNRLGSLAMPQPPGRATG